MYHQRLIEKRGGKGGGAKIINNMYDCKYNEMAESVIISQPQSAAKITRRDRLLVAA